MVQLAIHRVMGVTAEQAAEDCWHLYEDGTLVGLVRPWPPGPDWKLVDRDGGLSVPDSLAPRRWRRDSTR